MPEVYVSWKGTVTTGPLLIFHHEIQVINNTYAHEETSRMNSSGALWCVSESNAGVSWYFPDGTPVPGAPATIFQQNRVTVNYSITVLSRGIAAYDISDQSNGLWMCRLNESSDGELLVGMYHRDYR